MVRPLLTSSTLPPSSTTSVLPSSTISVLPQSAMASALQPSSMAPRTTNRKRVSSLYDWIRTDRITQHAAHTKLKHRCTLIQHPIIAPPAPVTLTAYLCIWTALNNINTCSLIGIGNIAQFLSVKFPGMQWFFCWIMDIEYFTLLKDVFIIETPCFILQKIYPFESDFFRMF